MVKLLGADRVVVHPNVTAVQAACARLKIAWQDAADHQPARAHLGAPGGGPGTERRQVDRLYRPGAHPGSHCPVSAGAGQGEARLCVLEDLGQETERLTWLSPAGGPGAGVFPLEYGGDSGRGRGNQPVSASRAAAGRPACTWGCRKRPWPIRAASSPRPRCGPWSWPSWSCTPGLTLWDVGAGCGSVGLEASLLIPGGQIIAVEQDQDRAAQIRANAGKVRGRQPGGGLRPRPGVPGRPARPPAGLHRRRRPGFGGTF